MALAGNAAAFQNVILIEFSQAYFQHFLPFNAVFIIFNPSCLKLDWNKNVRIVKKRASD
jgi:hypothetical protein